MNRLAKRRTPTIAIPLLMVFVSSIAGCFEGAVLDPCEEITCGGFGTCILGENGQPECVCLENHYLDGLGCQPCRPEVDLDGDGHINVRCGGDDCHDDDHEVWQCLQICGDGICTHDETISTCPSDCSAVCGDGFCSPTESICTCSDDCGRCNPDQCAPRGWARICAGSFAMGSPLDEVGRIVGETQHTVTLSRDFEIQTTEVTQAEFRALMGDNPSRFSDCDDCPVDSVTWHEAVAYCNAMSDESDLMHCYTCIGSGDDLECEPLELPYSCTGYRLPTEAEWEHAARAGTTTATYNGDLDDTSCSSEVIDPIAWYCGNSHERTHVVGSLTPNEWSLFDMLGNVSEWCHDPYDWYYDGPVTDPVGPATGTVRVVRGAGASSSARSTRSASRNGYESDYRSAAFGFRPARSLER